MIFYDFAASVEAGEGPWIAFRRAWMKKRTKTGYAQQCKFRAMAGTKAVAKWSKYIQMVKYGQSCWSYALHVTRFIDVYCSLFVVVCHLHRPCQDDKEVFQAIAHCGSSLQAVVSRQSAGEILLTSLTSVHWFPVKNSDSRHANHARYCKISTVLPTVQCTAWHCTRLTRPH